MKDLGPLHDFLVITIEHHPDGLFLHQRTYMLDVLKSATTTDCRLSMTLVYLQVKLAIDFGPLIQDASQFQSINGALQYLTFPRPDITYAIQQIYLHMHDPRVPI
jgi:hypothetical protein